MKREKKLIKCQICQKRGKKQTLYEEIKGGFLVVQRIHGSEKDYTIIRGNDFAIFCGYCGEPIYIHKKDE